MLGYNNREMAQKVNISTRQLVEFVLGKTVHIKLPVKAYAHILPVSGRV